MTVREMLSRIDSRELAEWMVYDSLEPIGSVRIDLAAGIVASTMANCHRGKNQRVFSPLDFMPFQNSERAGASEDIAAQLEANLPMLKGIMVKRESST